MNEPNELNYWQRYLCGDSGALSNLYMLYVDDLFSYGMKIYPDGFLVKDAIQDVFVGLIEKQGKLPVPGNIKAYISKSLRNKILEGLRTKNRKEEVENLIFKPYLQQTADDAEQILMASEENQNRHRIVRSALNRLSSHQREAVFLKFTNGYDYDQIADIMGLTVPSARTLIYRSIKQMKEFIFGDSPKTFHIYFFLRFL